MGEVISLQEWRADRSRKSVGPAAFFYSLDCPISYLSAERVERALGAVEWIPVVGPTSASSGIGSADERLNLAYELLAVAERDARALSLPLVEPQVYPMESRRAARAAVWAGKHDRGPTFALAVMRLAFCGGFDVSGDDVIGEAAAVSGLNPDHALDAARDYRHDYELEATASGLAAHGIPGPPAIRVGAHWFHGPDAVIAAVAYIAAQSRREIPRIDDDAEGERGDVPRLPVS